MAQFFPFLKSATQPFSFLVTLDNVQYSAIVTWSLAGQRWYINLYTTRNALVLVKPAVVSSATNQINLLDGYFTSTLIYDQPNEQFVASP